MTGSPRVLHVVPSLFGPGGTVGGGERYALELARHMADRTPTRLVSFGEEGRAERIGALEVRVLGGAWRVRGQRFNPFSPALPRELAWADVVHCHQQHVVASSVAAAVCRLLRRRVFVTDLGGGGWDISAYVSTDRWYHGHLHISEYSRRVFGHADNPRAHVILGGVDTERFSPAPRTALEETKTKAGEVLFVGRLLPHKGVNDLVEAVGPDLPLRILGPAPHARFLEDLRKLAAGKRVTFSPACTDEELVLAYRRACCVVLPSVYRTVYGEETQVPELLGQTLLEGMACGLPAVCTAVASMPEVVEHGVTGFVVPPNDPAALGERLRWLAAHPVEARRMGEAARARVLERFTWPQVVERCLGRYAAAGSPARPARRTIC